MQVTLRLCFLRLSQRGRVSLSAIPRACWDPGVCSRAVGAEERLAGDGVATGTLPNSPQTPPVSNEDLESSPGGGGLGSQAAGCTEVWPPQERWKEEHLHGIPSGLPWAEQGRVRGAQRRLR